MGFMDKLKSMKNYVTGGGAKVSLQIGNAARGVPIPVLVRAEIEGAPINATKIYVAARAVETVNLVHRDRDGGFGDKDRVHEAETTFSQEFVIMGPVQLAPNSRHEWQGQIMLPYEAQPTYRGKHAKHEWSFLAALDVAGNDPDSGWVEVHIA
jgi:hypothetical protein